MQLVVEDLDRACLGAQHGVAVLTHLLECEPLMQRVTGEALSHRPFMDYLWAKFGPLYGISRG